MDIYNINGAHIMTFLGMAFLVWAIIKLLTEEQK